MPMTFDDQTKFYALLDKAHMRPAKTRHEVGCTTTFTWFVDNDDDRFVEVRDSVRGQEFLVLKRDGKTAEVSIVGSPEEAFALMVIHTSSLTKF